MSGAVLRNKVYTREIFWDPNDPVVAQKLREYLKKLEIEEQREGLLGYKGITLPSALFIIAYIVTVSELGLLFESKYLFYPTVGSSTSSIKYLVYPMGVICSIIIICLCYKETHKTTYKVDYHNGNLFTLIFNVIFSSCFIYYSILCIMPYGVMMTRFDFHHERCSSVFKMLPYLLAMLYHLLQGIVCCFYNWVVISQCKRLAQFCLTQMIVVCLFDWYYLVIHEMEARFKSINSLEYEIYKYARGSTTNAFAMGCSTNGTYAHFEEFKTNASTFLIPCAIDNCVIIGATLMKMMLNLSGSGHFSDNKAASEPTKLVASRKGWCLGGIMVLLVILITSTINLFEYDTHKAIIFHVIRINITCTLCVADIIAIIKMMYFQRDLEISNPLEWILVFIGVVPTIIYNCLGGLASIEFMMGHDPFNTTALQGTFLLIYSKDNVSVVSPQNVTFVFNKHLQNYNVTGCEEVRFAQMTQKNIQDIAFLYVISHAVNLIECILSSYLLVDGLRKHTTRHDRSAMNCVSFACVTNIALWMLMVYEMMVFYLDPIQQIYFTRVTWMMVKNVTAPLCLLFRLHSAGCFFNIWHHAYLYVHRRGYKKTHLQR